MKAWVIVGTVRLRETKRGIQGLIVRAWDKDVTRDDFLGECVTNEEGGFQIRYSDQDFSDYGLESAPDVYIRIHVPGSDRVVSSTEAFPRDEAVRLERFDVGLSCWDFTVSDPESFLALRPILHGLVREAQSRRALRNLTVAILGTDGRELARAPLRDGAYHIWLASPPATAAVRILLPDGSTLAEVPGLSLSMYDGSAQNFDIDGSVLDDLPPHLGHQVG